MKRRFFLQINTVLVVMTAIATIAPSAQGRGGWISAPIKEYREPGLWYGDAYVSDDTKRALYKNYTPASQSNYNAHPTFQVVQPPPQSQPGYGYPTSSGPAATFSGPQHIDPEQYCDYVKVYDWSRSR